MSDTFTSPSHPTTQHFIAIPWEEDLELHFLLCSGRAFCREGGSVTEWTGTTLGHCYRKLFFFTILLSVVHNLSTCWSITVHHLITFHIKSNIPCWCISGDCRGLVYTECIPIIGCWQLLTCSQAAGLCTQAETVGVGCVHRSFSNTMSTSTIWACARLNTSTDQRGMPWLGLLSFDAFVLKISLGSPYILRYRWTFQGER